MRRNPPTGKTPPAPKAELHPRNRHRGPYDFPALIQACPELGPFVRPNLIGELSIDFADPAAVKALNRALLQAIYRIRGWDLPEGYLCPPIPGRADYLHHLADLLAQPGGPPPRGPALRVLDIGVGASAIYPLLGTREYGWTFVGSDIDPESLANARRILQANPDLEPAIHLRLQKARDRIFQGVVQPGEIFDACLCNPPFHASAREAREGTTRKWRNLGRATQLRTAALNFGGRDRELWCEGGESGFLARMIQESAEFAPQFRWFTSLVSKSAALPGIRAALARIGASEVRILPMAQGQKQSRIVAWRFA